MKMREQVVFDIREEKFRYLQRDEELLIKKVNMVDLSKRLNQKKINNIYNITKIITFSILCVGVFILISLKV